MSSAILSSADVSTDVPAKKRDERLDFWRGLCLIDMIFVHLAYYNEVQFSDFLRGLLTDYTRFAAGGFVFLSGLCLGRIFLSRTIRACQEQGHPFFVYRRIWARALKIYVIQILSSLALIWLFDSSLKITLLADPRQFILDMILMRRGNDLLLLYVGMLVLSPLMLELIRRNLWLLLLLASGILFYIGTLDPYRFAFIKPFQTQPGGKFPLLLWQLVFVSGMLFTRPLSVFDRSSRLVKYLVLLIVGALSIVIVISAFPDLVNRTTPILPLTFIKVPLSIGEYLRYMITTLLIMLVTDAGWDYINLIPFSGFICMLGRNSLFVYVIHLFLQELTIMVAIRFPDMGNWHLALGLGMIVLLGALAWGMELISGLRKKDRSKQAAHGRFAGSTGAVVGGKG